MKKFLVFLTILLISCGCCSLYQKHCHKIPIVDEQKRPIIFLADTRLPLDCDILFEQNFEIDIDILNLLDEMEKKLIDKEKILVTTQEIMYRWIKHGLLLKSQSLFVENCQLAIINQQEALLKRNQEFCENYKLIYSKEVDRCIKNEK